MKEQMYVIWSYEHSSWWRPHSMGYTVDINQAGLYTKDEAAKICDDANKYQPANEPHETMILQSEVKKALDNES